MNYSKICFVIMPFGKKKVGRRKIDFDFIYDSVFLPAINATKLPEGGVLEARRTDRDFFTGDISTEMFQYIEYSRFAVADISGLKPNVFYELGVRHHAHQSGTAIFRQIDVVIPFDINHIKAFPYEYEPQENIAKSIELVTRVLTESLVQNRIDSPVRIHLQQQQMKGNVDSILREAENAIRESPLPNLPKAIIKYNEAIKINSENPLLYHELGLLYRNQGKWEFALKEFIKATELSPTYSDAFRERGITENKIYGLAQKSSDLPTGENSLAKAIELNPEDFDALASLGGILKREERYKESLMMYQRSTEVSGGNPYPLLNELKLDLFINQISEINNRYKFYLKKIERILRAQSENNPPFDAPWCFFGLSEVCLFLNDEAGFLKYLDEGIFCINPQTLSWQAETHRKSLELLQQSKLILTGLNIGIEKLREAEIFLPKKIN